MSTDGSTGTHPVYIGRDLKKDVKVEATQRELTMRQITERLINRGMDKGFHEEPLPKEFHDKLDDLDEESQRVRDLGDVDRLEGRLESLESRLEAADLPESEAESSIQSRIDAVADTLETARDDLDE